VGLACVINSSHCVHVLYGHIILSHACENDDIGPKVRIPNQACRSQGLLYSQGNYNEAEPLCRHALRIRQKALGEEHLYTRRSLKNLAVCLAKVIVVS
jgi:hypothetical protein